MIIGIDAGADAAYEQGLAEGRAAEREAVKDYLDLIARSVFTKHADMYNLAFTTTKNPLEVIRSTIRTAREAVHRGDHILLENAKKEATDGKR